MKKIAANISAHVAKAISSVLGPFLPAWFLRNGRKNAEESQLERASSSCEWWGIWCGALVIIAVIAEAYIAIRHPGYDSGLFRWGSAVTDVFVAAGIVGEVALGMWDGRIQTELRTRSNKELGEAKKFAAEAERRAATAHARASASLAMAATARDSAFRLRKELTEANVRLAEATQRAAETELKLRRLTSPRVPNRELFLQALAAGTDKPARIEVVYSVEGADCSTLAAWISQFLRDAGWPAGYGVPIVRPPGMGVGISDAQWAGGQPWGVTVISADLKKDGGPAMAIMRALHRSLGEGEAIAAVRGPIHPDVIKIVVGPRP